MGISFVLIGPHGFEPFDGALQSFEQLRRYIWMVEPKEEAAEGARNGIFYYQPTSKKEIGISFLISSTCFRILGEDVGQDDHDAAWLSQGAGIAVKKRHIFLRVLDVVYRAFPGDDDQDVRI